MSISPVARFRLGDLTIQTGSRSVMRAGVDLGITGLSFELLLALGYAYPNLLSLNDILDTVWAGQDVGAEVVSQRIRLLRRQLGDESDRPRYIGSRRNHGYRLLMPMHALGHIPTVDPQAQARYLQARAMMRGTHSSRDTALRYLDEALEREPHFAAALAHRALLIAGSIPLSGVSSARLTAAETDANRALEQEPSLVDAHAALGIIEACRHDWPAANAHFARATSIAPDDTFSTNLHASFVLRQTGRLREALAAHRRCHDLAPTDGFTLHELVLTHSLLGEDDQARQWWNLSETLSGNADPPWDIKIAFSRAAMRGSEWDLAARLAHACLPDVLRNTAATAAIDAFHAAQAGRGSRAHACSLLASLVRALGAGQVDGRTRGYFISLPALLGDSATALTLLEQLLFPLHGSPACVELSDLWLPELRELRSDSRFGLLRRRLGFAPG
jgi:DNA-binding winged helix-turn-helix (wHTH) protein